MRSPGSIILVLMVIAANTVMADLPRRAFLGAALLEVSDSLARDRNLEKPGGVLVDYVLDGSTAESIGLLNGDIILSANEKHAGSTSAFIRQISGFSEGDPIELTIQRGTTILTLTGNMAGFPPETSPYARVIYDQVPFEDGYVRTIIHKPDRPGKHPALFFIQGYTCTSMDNLHEHSPVRKLLEGVSKEGYVVIKTEKAGVGDSRSSRGCRDVNLFEEVALFEASFNALKKYDFIDHDNVFVFGHSMGGVQAPLMNTEFEPGGIIVFGTVVRPWFDYFTEQHRKQRLMMGQDYLENEAAYQQAVRFYYRFMIEKESPEMLLQDPEMAEFLENNWRSELGGVMNDRHYTFWQQLQDTNLFRAWSETSSPVLSLHGEGEYIAFNPWEHELIADIVNKYNPGKAQFVSVPNTDHSFIFVNDIEHAITVRNDAQYWRENFNQDVVRLVVEWMDEIRTGDRTKDK